MKFLDRYIIKIFVKIFMFTTSAIALVGIISELFRHISLYMDNKTPFYPILIHLLSDMPRWLIQVLSIATLLALLFSLGDLSKNNEITAIKAAGINIWRIIILFFIIGFVIGTGDFAVKEFIVPKTSLYNKVIEKEKIRKEKINTKTKTELSDLIAPVLNNTRVTIDYLNTEENIMKNIAIEKFSDKFKTERLILAEAGIWENDSWLLKNGVVRNFNADFWDETHFEQYNSNIHIKPEDMAIQQDVSYDAMSMHALKKYINQLRALGQTTVKERIILNMRFADVFAYIIVMIIGIPFGIGFENKLNKILSFTLAMTAAFIYWGTQAIAKSLGENLILSPFIAAWLPNLIFSAIGVYLLVKVKK
ncbi:MAG: LptF/LptG family permease [Endomicrobium sp.]|jgi:lipopolysaccharide export system permease protein|nr:LptF/LptG family permease [Endomicrobium sp.]